MPGEVFQSRRTKGERTCSGEFAADWSTHQAVNLQVNFTRAQLIVPSCMLPSRSLEEVYPEGAGDSCHIDQLTRTRNPGKRKGGSGVAELGDQDQ